MMMTKDKFQQYFHKITKIYFFVILCLSNLSVAGESCLKNYQLDVVELQFYNWRGEKNYNSQQLKKMTSMMEWTHVYYLGTGMTESYLVKHSGLFSGIFKPFPEFWVYKDKAKSFATNPNAEVLAFEVSLLTGLANVPLTVLKKIRNMKGSWQLFVPKKEDESSILAEEKLIELKVFDYLINNTDRRNDNIIETDEFVVAIDHSQSFKITPPLISEESVRKLVQRLSPTQKSRLLDLHPSQLLEVSKDLITEEEQNALLVRFHKLRSYL